MAVCLISNGIVAQRWDDVGTLAELSAKYGLSGPQYVEADAAPGMIANGNGTFSPPPPPAPVLPDEVAKLALVRAMRMVTMTGAAAGANDAAWTVIKPAIAAAGGSVHEDWEMAIRIPKADPALNALLATFIPDATQRAAVLDAVFTLAGQIERGEVAP